ncbi:peroxisomal coenzyme A diphosphatase NUDT7 isoform X2 [Cyclopterus lumpus]|uniref:peroxisomal coenzyme A diphosphatase NUDT7 isoform X2 n=1 Tax=Cyclopterus lumpus TaxID=8103 RepID=UPI001485C9AA|nr:peroxisomal coenzyme A diphosphatase NUDT7 isoform X2 [Cyclopterus lumpus]
MHIKEETIAILKQFDIGNKFASLPVLPKASVLIPLMVKNGELCTLMTLRSQELRTSPGEVCFPGGKRDPSDGDDVDTALREAEEEISLPPADVQVVCRLVPIINKSGLLVTPVVGFIEESFCPRPNPAETPIQEPSIKYGASQPCLPYWLLPWLSGEHLSLMFLTSRIRYPSSNRFYFEELANYDEPLS